MIRVRKMSTWPSSLSRPSATTRCAPFPQLFSRARLSPHLLELENHLQPNDFPECQRAPCGRSTGAGTTLAHSPVYFWSGLELGSARSEALGAGTPPGLLWVVEKVPEDRATVMLLGASRAAARSGARCCLALFTCLMSELWVVLGWHPSRISRDRYEGRNIYN